MSTMPNLSSWTVTFTRGLLGWAWVAKHADRTELRNPFGMGSLEKRAAEKDALRHITRYEQREEVNGFELQKRLNRPAGENIDTGDQERP